MTAATDRELADRELAVRQLAAELDQAPTTIRKALANLEAAGLVVAVSRPRPSPRDRVHLESSK